MAGCIQSFHFYANCFKEEILIDASDEQESWEKLEKGR
jgi:hypothetical protein